MKIINKIQIDTSFLPKTTSIRDISVFGEPGSVFSLYVQNELDEDSTQYYNFETSTFQNLFTSILQQTIDNSGFFLASIKFPTVTDADEYNIYVVAEPHFNTSFSSNLVSKGFIYKVPNEDNSVNSDGSLIYPSSIYQLLDKTISFNFAHSNAEMIEADSGVLATALVMDASTTTGTVTIDKTSLAAVNTVKQALCISRQPVAADFYATKTQTVNGAVANGTTVVLDAIDKLSIGFTLYSSSGGGDAVPHSGSVKPIIQSINTNTKTLTLSQAVTVSDGATLTFRGYGSSATKKMIGLSYTVSNFSASLPNLGTNYDGSIINVETTLSSEFVVGASTMVVASTAGIAETGSSDNENGGTYIYASGLVGNIPEPGSGDEVPDPRFLAAGVSNATTFSVAAMSDFAEAFFDLPVVEEGTAVYINGTASSFNLTCNLNITEADQTATLNLDLDKFINFFQNYS
tara:strand:- start:1188 stop:2567 length:1380 start_codon:yes stop_codon:yes gene_type:complete